MGKVKIYGALAISDREQEPVCLRRSKYDRLSFFKNTNRLPARLQNKGSMLICPDCPGKIWKSPESLPGSCSEHLTVYGNIQFDHYFRSIQGGFGDFI
jgi:hypothetical protein